MKEIANNYPSITEEEAEIITNNFCGVTPEIKNVEYHIWLNQEKLKYYEKYPFYKGEQHIQHIDSFKKLIACGKKLLKDLKNQATSTQL